MYLITFLLLYLSSFKYVTWKYATVVYNLLLPVSLNTFQESFQETIKFKLTIDHYI